MKWNFETDSLEIEQADLVDIRASDRTTSRGLNILVKNWFDKQPRVQGVMESRPGSLTAWLEGHDGEITHQAILIGVRPIKQETVEDILRELLDDLDRIGHWTNVESHIDKRDGLIERAKKVLENK